MVAFAHHALLVARHALLPQHVLPATKVSSKQPPAHVQRAARIALPVAPPLSVQLVLPATLCWQMRAHCAEPVA